MTKSDYKILWGEGFKQIIKTLNSTEYPALGTVSQIVELKNKAFYSSDKEFKCFWWNQGFDTSDALVYSKEGILVVKDSLKTPLFSENSEMSYSNLKNSLNEGGMRLTPEQYSSLEGRMISGKELEKYKTCRLDQDLMSSEIILQDPVWDYLFQGNRDLLREHIHYLFKGEKQKNVMRFIPGSYLANGPLLKLIHIKGKTSDLSGMYGLDEDRGRFVAISDEVVKREALIEELRLKRAREFLEHNLEPTGQC
ncbi:MAG TPA: hypothetical protein PLK34_03250 [Candidatus Pacearchaeota archaeon]|nr:hypothetical protein [Candidatus Pacearchaeota archaeon]